MKGAEEWLAYLTADELAAWRETDQWLHAEASRFRKMWALTRKPIEYAYSKVPESLRESIASSILTVLTSVRDGTSNLVSMETVYERIGPVPPGELGIFQVGLGTLDEAAQGLIGQSRNLCTAEGAATGVAGLPGIIVDIPALYGLLFRMIAQVAACYGYSAEPDAERDHILKILDIGHQSDPEAKRQGMDELAMLQQMIRDAVPVAEVQRFAVEKGLQTMARHLGLALTQRKLAQSVVLVGGVVGAGVNRQLAGDVGEVAFHAYRRRHLLELAYLRRSGQLDLTALGPSPEVAAPLPAEPLPAVPPPAVPPPAVHLVAAEQVPILGDFRGGGARITLDTELMNRLLRPLQEYQLEYRHGCFLGRVKLPIGAVRAVIIPSCNGSHLVFTLPFQEIKSEGAGSFFLSKIVSTFWGTIAKQIESNAIPRLMRLGFSSDTLTLERGKGSAGEYGQIKFSLNALNLWLASKHRQWRATVDTVVFTPQGVVVQGRLEV